MLFTEKGIFYIKLGNFCKKKGPEVFAHPFPPIGMWIAPLFLDMKKRARHFLGTRFPTHQ